MNEIKKEVEQRRKDIYRAIQTYRLDNHPSRDLQELFDSIQHSMDMILFAFKESSKERTERISDAYWDAELKGENFKESMNTREGF